MFEEIVGSSEPMRQVLRQVAKVAPSDSTVLILGETGTGKELIARALHRRSGRSAKPFIRVNCAEIPPALIASELFGQEKGAFTGALQKRIGRFESADGGTLFLDEVGDLPAETQIALLRVLQEREIERVGSNHPMSVDVRLIAATNRDLGAAVASGTFREDLFFRLNVVRKTIRGQVLLLHHLSNGARNAMLNRVEERKTTPRIDAPRGGGRDRLKIERQSDGKTTIIWLIGRIRGEHLEEIKRQMGDPSERTIFDLSEVTIVDADVVRFLSACEREGIRLASCSPYVREWILQERAEGGSRATCKV
jgi:hypothetical protein